MQSVSVLNSYFEDSTIMEILVKDNRVTILLSFDVYSYMIANGFREECNDLNLVEINFLDVKKIKTNDLERLKYVQECIVDEKTISLKNENSLLSFEFANFYLKKVKTMEE